MINMKRITRTKEIKTGDNSGVVFSDNERASYATPFIISDYGADDLVTFFIASQLADNASSDDIQLAYAGPSAPLSTLGNNGDFYYIVPNDSSFIELRQKISGAWVAVFTVPLISTVTKIQSDLVTDGFGGFLLKFNLPGGREIASISTKSGAITTRIDSSLAITDTSSSPNTTVSGFPNNSTQTITIKLT
jgi:hypothetical protein